MSETNKSKANIIDLSTRRFLARNNRQDKIIYGNSYPNNNDNNYDYNTNKSFSNKIPTIY